MGKDLHYLRWISIYAMKQEFEKEEVWCVNQNIMEIIKS